MVRERTIEEKRKIFDEIHTLLKPPEQEEGEFTIKEYLTYCLEQGVEDMTHQKAYKLLMGAVRNGLMTRRKVLKDSHWPWAFKRISQDEDEGKDKANVNSSVDTDVTVNASAS